MWRIKDWGEHTSSPLNCYHQPRCIRRHIGSFISNHINQTDMNLLLRSMSKWLTLLLQAITFISMGQAPNIQQVALLNNEVELFEKFEAQLVLSATYDNPYDYDEVNVGARFVGPDQREFIIDGFYAEGYRTTDAATGRISRNGLDGFRVRFAPDTIGTWTVQVWVQDSNGVDTAAIKSFTCVNPTNPKNEGYVRTNDSKYLSFDTGNPYVPIGHNICWSTNNRLVDFQNWLGKLSENGGNFFRLWHCHWGISLEWLGNGYQGLKQYRQDNAHYLDELHDMGNEEGIYIMVCLQHHGQVSTRVNPNWSESPYNTSNGGMCANTSQFFSNEEAKAATKNRLRYIVARYGYARSVMAWELFNEVNWTDNFEQNDQLIADWHEEMAGFLKEIDPYGHLVTTSYADESQGELVWTLPEIDLTQTHYYLPSANLERALAHGAKGYQELYDKPTLVGEFGINTQNVNLRSLDPDGIYIHNGLLGGFFGGGFGTAASWWWDNYIHPQDLYYHYKGLSEIIPLVPLKERHFTPTKSYTTGAKSDLSISPTVGWGKVATSSITVDSRGELLPEGAFVASYLYGSTSNVQFRSPPEFTVNYPRAGTFQVTTGPSTSNGTPRINIYVDGQRVLNEAAQINTTYTIDLTAGAHVIKVDNSGRDWVSISEYEFSDIGSALDTYVLASEDSTQFSAWILNHQYNHEVVYTDGLPDSVKGAKLVIPDVSPGSYFAKWYNPLSGAWLNTELAKSEGDSISVNIPAVQWDLILVLDQQFVASTSPQKQQVALSVFPNPVVSEPLTVSFPSHQVQSGDVVHFSLHGLDGRVLHTWNEASWIAQGKISIDLPTHIPSGTYWLKSQSATHGGVVAIQVKRG